MQTILQKNIKQRLAATNISVAELERRAGVPHAVINIMHGRSKNPSIRVAQAIAKELGCSLEDLISDENTSQTEINTKIDTIKKVNKKQTAKWQASLFQESFEAVQNFLIKNNIKTDIDNIFDYLDEVYRYSLGNQSQTVDHRFVEWLGEHSF